VTVRILALETSLHHGSLALLAGDRVVSQVSLPAGARSAQSLAPALATILRAAGWQPQDVALVAVASGPGSFTGLRVGVTTAKTFAYAAGADVVGVNTLEVLAAQCTPATDGDELWAVMDAQRSELFAAQFVRGVSGQWQPAIPVQIIGRDAWLARLTPRSHVTGPGLTGIVGRIDRSRVEPEHNWLPRAETVGVLGWQLLQAGTISDVWSLQPQYYRQSAAEEKAR
jgi:tRNA threonylcarbamoyladenosine biosynthesis protein TsaB